MSSATANVNINVIAHDKTKGVFGSVQSGFSKLGSVASGLAVAGFSAVASGVGKSLQEFTKFENGMNEVFTLLPGVSQAAMSKMEQQVLGLSKQMGVLPENVVPALYQSLSAGVPQDNVFAFLEQSQKAAVGGITDLTTSVDAISSVVNAYGSDVMDAATASDVMFTTVRLGKTTFGELASSLSDVNPIASALNVQFGDVGAALATMTAQGTSTAQSTTQLKSLLSELGKSGTKVATIFQNQTGKSLSEFTAEGGNMADVMQVLTDASAELEMPIQDMFGSIEAGGAALKLTGKAFDTFKDNIDATADSAGATEAAYEQMNKGFKRVGDRLKSSLSASFIQIGIAMSPILDKVTVMVDRLLPVFEGWISTAAGALTTFFSALDEGMSPVNAFSEAFNELMPQEMLDTWLNLRDNILPALSEWFLALWENIQPLVAQAIDVITNFVQVKDVLMALGIILGVVVLSAVISVVAALWPLLAVGVLLIGAVALLRNAWENNWGGIQEKTAAVMAFIQGIITTVMDAVKAFWEENGDAILEKANVIWTTIQETVVTIAQAIGDFIRETFEAVKAFWDEHGESILAKATEIWTGIQNFITEAVNTISKIVTEVMDAVRAFWEENGAEIKASTTQLWNFLKEKVTTKITEIRTEITNTLNRIKNFWNTHRTQIQNIVKNLWDATKKIFSLALQTITEAFHLFVDAVTGDWKAFGERMKAIWQLAWNGVKTAFLVVKTVIKNAVDNMVTDLKDRMVSAVEAIRSKFDSAMSAISGAIDSAKEKVNSIKGAVESFWNWLKGKTFSIKVNVPSLPPLPGFAAGGPIKRNTLSVVGEKGPELFVPNVDGKIVPNHQIGSVGGEFGASGGGSSSTVINNYNIEAKYDYRPGVDVIDDIKSMQLLQG